MNTRCNAQLLQKATLAFFPPRYFLDLGVNELLCCPMLSGYWWFAGDFPSLKPTPKVCSFVEKLDWAWKCLFFFTNAGKKHIVSYGIEHLMAASQTP